MATSSTGASGPDLTPARRYTRRINPGYSDCMGIQLSDFSREMIKQVAQFRDDRIHPNGYLFGYITARVDQFLKGAITREQLADDAALVELIRTLDSRCSTAELRAIAAGTRELPGEDVQSGQ